MGIAAPFIRTLAKLATGETPVVSGKTAWRMGDALAEEAKAWIMGAENARKPALPVIFRGVYSAIKKGTKPPVEEFMHATPWPEVASRAGTIGGGFSTKVYAYPATKELKFYRGGSLAGDPLESTSISSIQGMTWDKALDKAKELYQTELLRQRAKLLRDAKNYGFPENMVLRDYNAMPNEIGNRVTRDFIHATFETDLRGKSGIWVGQHVPREMQKRMPRLRSYNDLVEVLEERAQQGYSLEDIISMPEARILKRGRPEMYKELLETINL